MHVDISRDMAASDKHVAVMRAAAILQAFYNSNHNLGRNMPSDKRGRGSDDGASAASAHVEPVQKAVKTE